MPSKRKPLGYQIDVLTSWPSQQYRWCSAYIKATLEDVTNCCVHAGHLDHVSMSGMLLWQLRIDAAAFKWKLSFSVNGRSIQSKFCADRKLFCCFFIVNINWFMLTCIVRLHMHFSPIKMLSFSKAISTRAFIFIRAMDTLHPAPHLLRDLSKNTFVFNYRYSVLWPQASSNLKKKDLILGQRRLERGQRDRNA